MYTGSQTSWTTVKDMVGKHCNAAETAPNLPEDLVKPLPSYWELTIDEEESTTAFFFYNTLLMVWEHSNDDFPSSSWQPCHKLTLFRRRVVIHTDLFATWLHEMTPFNSLSSCKECCIVLHKSLIGLISINTCVLLPKIDTGWYQRGRGEAKSVLFSSRWHFFIFRSKSTRQLWQEDGKYKNGILY